MSIQKLMNQPLTVQPMGGTGTDEYGNNVPEALGAPVAELGFLELSDTVEYIEDRATTVSRWSAFLFANSAVTPQAYITFQFQRFQVDGQPWAVYNPRTKQVDHIECKLVVVL